MPGLHPHTLHPGAIQGKEGIKFCHLAIMREGDAGEGEDEDSGSDVSNDDESEDEEDDDE